MMSSSELDGECQEVGGRRSMWAVDVYSATRAATMDSRRSTPRPFDALLKASRKALVTVIQRKAAECKVAFHLSQRGSNASKAVCADLVS